MVNYSVVVVEGHYKLSSNEIAADLGNSIILYDSEITLSSGFNVISLS